MPQLGSGTPVNSGGPEGARTPDLCIANAALSQSKFVDDFAAAWNKAMNLGCFDLSGLKRDTVRHRPLVILSNDSWFGKTNDILRVVSTDHANLIIGQGGLASVWGH